VEEEKTMVESELYESNVVGVTEGLSSAVDKPMIDSLGESAVNPFEEDIQGPGSSIENVREIT